ncbi:hypothetical protein [Sneathiella sp. HT1-7]|uniref:hypothetical protein n=1 Tax=Sneathiella sp. HT1-7 TaxID=2887192 RepID=UPI001D13FB91|nr:hypothetical protein [Sneathiella sp. HT1-7]MCC3305083.1 hypothetical protein [Sneathiella sp. HT1-7]
MSGSLDYSNADVVDRLVSLYDHSFGGKPRGRYRISMKLMCRIVNQRRLWPEQIEAIRRGLYETGHILIDLGTYFVVVNQRTFSSYRRLNEASIATLEDALAGEISGELEDETSDESENSAQDASGD